LYKNLTHFEPLATAKRCCHMARDIVWLRIRGSTRVLSNTPLSTTTTADILEQSHVMIPSSIPVELCLPIFLSLMIKKTSALCALSRIPSSVKLNEFLSHCPVTMRADTLLWSHRSPETPRLAKLVCSLTLSAAVHLDKCNILVAAFGAIINLKKLVILNLLGEWSSRSHFNPRHLKVAPSA